MSRFVPTKQQYTKTLQDISDDLRGTVIVRLLCECGIAREEVVNLERGNLNRFHPRGLWIEKAKRIKKGKKYEMRSREVPLNSSLYTLLQAYLSTHTSPYIIDRARHGAKPEPLTPRMINTVFEKMGVKWSPHDCRHFFRSQVRRWMLHDSHMGYDVQMIKEIMGHVLNVHEKYGGETDFECKLKVVDKVFG